MTFRIGDRVRSVRYAWRGIGVMLRTQHNAWIHAVATGVALALGAWLRIDAVEWLVVLLVILSVWIAEALNTAFEALCDVTSPEFHPMVERAKDVAAGAVLIAAIGALVAAVIIFGPRLARLLG